MTRRSQFTLFLILLLFLSTFVAAAHHHDAADDDRDCPVCVASHHQSAACPSLATADGVPFVLETKFVPVSAQYAQNPAASSLNNRAPPA